MSQSFAPLARPRSSPWGEIDHAKEVAPGIWCVTTPGHGGYLLSTERRLAMPDHLKNVYTFAGANWFEEDCDWCIVALAYPDAFPPEAQEHARATLASFDHEPTSDYQRRPYYVSMRRAAQAMKAAG
jgi:hypothetical protein